MMGIEDGSNPVSGEGERGEGEMKKWGGKIIKLIKSIKCVVEAPAYIGLAYSMQEYRREVRRVAALRAVDARARRRWLRRLDRLSLDVPEPSLEHCGDGQGPRVVRGSRHGRRSQF